jgi:hypothetical protein
VIDLLNRIVELELAGAVHYTQYSLMVFGHARIPIMDWMREQAVVGVASTSPFGETVPQAKGSGVRTGQNTEKRCSKGSALAVRDISQIG